MISHHLDPLTLMRYAAGNLDEAFLLVVASHLALCDECRSEARKAEELGGALLDSFEPDTVDTAQFTQLMERLETAGDTAQRHMDGRLAAADHLPLPLRRHVGPRLDDIPWRTVIPGVRKHVVKLESTSPSALYLLWVAPGRAMPEHGHGGAELTMILSGAYCDEMGRFAPGDVADLDEHVEHTPVVDGSDPCICVVAAETQIRFKGLIARLMQPFVGI